jgi:hypothetical protein
LSLNKSLPSFSELWRLNAIALVANLSTTSRSVSYPCSGLPPQSSWILSPGCALSPLPPSPPFSASLQPELCVLALRYPTAVAAPASSVHPPGGIVPHFGPAPPAPAPALPPPIAKAAFNSPCFALLPSGIWLDRP